MFIVTIRGTPNFPPNSRPAENLAPPATTVRLVPHHTSKPRNAGLNVHKVLYDLVDVVEKTNTLLAEHKHGVTTLPDNAAEFSSNSAITASLYQQMLPITEKDP